MFNLQLHFLASKMIRYATRITLHGGYLKFGTGLNGLENNERA